MMSIGDHIIIDYVVRHLFYDNVCEVVVEMAEPQKNQEDGTKLCVISKYHEAKRRFGNMQRSTDGWVVILDLPLIVLHYCIK